MTQPRNTLRILACFGLVALLHLTAAAAVHAQTGTAALVGDVVDSQKQVIPGATVTLTHVATTASQVTTTDERGAFRLANVQPGVYTLRVELTGFKTAIVEQVTLQVDSVTPRNGHRSKSAALLKPSAWSRRPRISIPRTPASAT